ncbi:MAG: DNA mismatch repair endonuclease MutL, partial [Oscillospiraceae bacterium]
MPRIQQLSPHVADLIAAGEVVERPASVVKELLENAIDAGAAAITAEIAGGGMTLIRVTDNGGGIPAEDVQTAFLPHATSKLHCEQDLEAIGTLGFRGEALAAIAAVSRIELMTKTADAQNGTALTIEGGTILEQEEAGCPEGTTMVVRDLFYNTPARLKFMKRDVAEGAAVFAVVQHAALSHPEISFTFLRDGKNELHTPGDGALKSALYSVLGRDIALGFTPVTGSGEGISVAGFTSLPACCRGTRGYQHFFVNGRYVKSRTMMAAVEEAYKNQKMVGKFPGCVLQLTMRLSAVDVNVHPTKTEVKFVSDKAVFDGIYYSVLSSLGEGNTRPAAVLAPPQPLERAAIQQTMTLRDIQTPGSHEVYYAKPAAVAPTAPPVKTPAVSAVVPTLSHVEPPAQRNFAPAPEPAAIPTPMVSAPPIEQSPALPWRLVGEVLNTYIIVEQGETVLFIDKHAAHERMQFDKLKAAGYRPMAQQLLTPLVLTPAPEETAALLANLP